MRHRCPECREWTKEKYYCVTCRTRLKKPGWINFKRKDIYWTERSHCAGRAT